MQVGGGKRKGESAEKERMCYRTRSVCPSRRQGTCVQQIGSVLGGQPPLPTPLYTIGLRRDSKDKSSAGRKRKKGGTRMEESAKKKKESCATGTCTDT